MGKYNLEHSLFHLNVNNIYYLNLMFQKKIKKSPQALFHLTIFPPKLQYLNKKLNYPAPINRYCSQDAL